MALANGTRFDHYEILAPIGAGGMGEVYRARDTKLGRDVAFKVLPDAVATDPEYLIRFQREGKLLASLNHPNIAQIYGIVESNRTRGIVMELVAGETLQSRLKRGRISIDNALSFAKQIAGAAEAAHERGIIHRDLKPGNIMVDGDGKVKVLDFGLAKAVEPNRPDPDLANSPTLVTTLPASANVLIGTAPYMSPEQARGQASGALPDIWAFGCILYEMLTGRQTFEGDTVADLIGSIVRIDPDWAALPPNAPPALRAILKRCLEKDRRRRYHAIGDVRLDLEELESSPNKNLSVVSPTRHRAAWLVAPVLAAIAGLLVGILYFRRNSDQPPASRFSIEMPAEA